MAAFDQGLYDTNMPLEFNAILQIGCVCKVDKAAKRKNPQDGWTLDELHMKTTTECSYLEQSFTFFYLYHSHRHHVPAIAVIECPKVHLMKSGIHALDDFPSANIPCNACDSNYQDMAFCKAILNEYAVKMNLQSPTYSTIRIMGLLPYFTTSLVFNGVTYTGEAGMKKKDAEQLAARAVILSIFDNNESGTVLPQIIKSKIRLLSSNTPLAANTGASFVNEIELETTGNGNATIAVVETGSSSGFVPPTMEQPLVGGPSSAKKQNRAEEENGKTPGRCTVARGCDASGAS